MKSIRRSTIAGVVLLLCCALGSISALIYRSSRNALEEKNVAIRDLLERQFEGDRDAAMLAEVRTFATLADVDLKWERIEPFQVIVTEVQAHEEMLARSADEAAHEFLQITAQPLTAQPRTWRSQSLRDEGGSLPPPGTTPAAYEHNFLDIKFNGHMLRVITLKVPLDHYAIDQRRISNSQLHRDTILTVGGGGTFGLVYPPPMNRRPPGNALPNANRNPPRIERTTPMAVIQVGWNAREHPAIQKLRAQYEAQVDRLADDATASLARLRVTFYALGLATLAVAVLGGGMVVTRALKPLRVLSEAVSQVSEKDFALRLNARAMPVELRPTVEKLKSALEMLRRAFEREKQATADISHELRTPIASLNATLDVCLRKPRTADEYRDAMADCRMIGKEMSGLVERIMALAYLDAGEVPLKDEAVNGNDLLGVCGAIGRPLAEAQGLKFSMNLQPDIRLRTDPDKLREVVMNLLHNAIEYNRPGGEVVLSAKSVGKNGLEVDVRDTGIGIAADIREKIFERFYRADASRSNTGVHAGLGLAIVREYVNRLGGSLELLSEPGTGSQFKVKLPSR